MRAIVARNVTSFGERYPGLTGRFKVMNEMETIEAEWKPYTANFGRQGISISKSRLMDRCWLTRGASPGIGAKAN